MRVLVINCGSTSIKTAIIDTGGRARRIEAEAERLSTAEAALVVGDEREPLGDAGRDHRTALEALLPRLLAQLARGERIEAVGHRVVHGGARFHQAVAIDDQVELGIEKTVPLAPLHNPANLAGVRAARAALPDVPHVAVFDTAFHATLPARARYYALPHELAEQHGLRRYGFHGPSHELVARRAASFLDCELDQLRIITCHLGGGCSVCAVEYGRSVETSMGMTPLEGLVMGSRSGDLDPGVLLSLMRTGGYDADALDELLNKRSGLAGVSGIGRDMRDIEQRAAEGDERCRRAIQLFSHRLRKYIGAYAAVMGGVDAIAFTAGIGENSALIRHRVAQRLDFLGARIDEDRNRDARVEAGEQDVVEISDAHSRCRLLVVATDEELAIAQQAAAVAEHRDRVASAETRPIPVAISARHVHLTPQAVEALFGAGHQLTEYKPLSQPGQFAAHERVALIGPRGRIERVRVLGPVRPADQVEISRSDEFILGIDAPVRASGDVANSPGITLEGPAGRLVLDHGVICAWRHIHMHPDDAEHFGVQQGDIVEVAIDSAGRDLVFGDVLVRVSPKYALEMHVDTDEGNAAELEPGGQGALRPTGGTAQLRAKRPRAG